MNSLAPLVASCLINSLWEIALIGAAGWAASLLLTRLGPRIQHVVWVTTLALAVLTPLLPLGRLLALPQRSVTANPVRAVALIVAQSSAPVAAKGLALPFSLILIATLCYLAVVLYFAIRLALIAVRTAILVRRARPAHLTPQTAELWHRCQETFAIDDALILTSPEVPGPVTAGILRKKLLLPEGFADRCDSKDLLAAFAHECAHMARSDFRKNLLYEIASLAIAFHPVTWFIKSQIAQTREMICDDLATGNLIDHRTYTESLLRLVTMILPRTGMYGPNAIGIFDANILEKRIMIMRTSKPHLNPILKYILPALGGLLLFVAAAACTLAPSLQAQASDAHSSDAKFTPILVTLDPAVGKAAGAPNMDCTYYQLGDKRPIPHMGTCGVSPSSSTSYICTANPDKQLSDQPPSQPQIGCRWKVDRYITWQTENKYRAKLKSQPGNTPPAAANNPDK
jgi:beta-lactamase regulating signal transducer with metallopeptidase domain